jgi:hypothetical protein
MGLGSAFGPKKYEGLVKEAGFESFATVRTLPLYPFALPNQAPDCAHARSDLMRACICICVRVCASGLTDYVIT